MKSTDRTVSNLQWVPEWVSRITAPGSSSTGRVESILRYLREEARYDIDVRPNVPLGQSPPRNEVQPENEDHALFLLKQAVADIGCAVVQKRRVLTIVTAHEAKKHYLPLPTLAA